MIVWFNEELNSKWIHWVDELEKCDELCIPLSIIPSNGNVNEMQFEIIGFGDGSSVACGTAVYLRWHDMEENNIEVKFLGAKGKLNPLEGTTVPRSELSGALLTSKLVQSVESSIKDTEINQHFKEKLLFSDSTTVLAWVKSASIKYQPFVKNKIMQIQELHTTKSWHFIPGRQNTAADLVSKGCRFKDIERIIKGPDILYQRRKDWPEEVMELNKLEVDVEKCSGVNVLHTTINESPIDINRFSSWKKLVRTTAYVQKYIRTSSDPWKIHARCFTYSSWREIVLEQF